MGNQSPPLIPPNYPEFAHHSLATAKLTKHQNKLEILFEQGPSTQIYTHWKTHLNSLPLPNKYLFLPELENREDVVDLCCNSDALYRFDSYAAAIYQPYVYTLQRQIRIRKHHNRHFREHQIWKLLKTAVLALRDWENAFQIPIGKIIPSNVVMNYAGKIKLVNAFSFLEEDTRMVNWSYIPPEKRLNPVIKYNAENGGNSNTMGSIYSLGVVLLEAICLQQSDYSQISTNEKKKFLEESDLYTQGLKKTILKMTEEEVNERINIYELQLILKEYAEITKDH